MMFKKLFILIGILAILGSATPAFAQEILILENVEIVGWNVLYTFPENSEMETIKPFNCPEGFIALRCAFNGQPQINFNCEEVNIIPVEFKNYPFLYCGGSQIEGIIDLEITGYNLTAVPPPPPPPASASLNLGFTTASSSDLLASVGALFIDLWAIIALMIGIPLAFYIIQRVIKLTPTDRDKLTKGFDKKYPDYSTYSDIKKEKADKWYYAQKGRVK